MSSKTKKTVSNKPKPRIAANGYRLCDPLPKGEILIDSTNNKWILGSPIGSGGFGEIYSCSRSGDRVEYVMKLDNIDGPLFAEMNFYLRVAKEESINEWMSKKGLKFLAIPKYIASGIHDKSPNNKTIASNNSLKAKRNGPTLQYRFLVMQRFGDELQKLITDNKLTTNKACDIASKMIDALEYIHSFGYIHADIKATNILLANIKPTKTDENYYLVDYGLAERYRNANGTHREEKADKKRANNGTVEYRSRDAHIGLISRRSDIECLAYNLIQWLYGTLPWIKSLDNAIKVQKMKEDFMDNIDEFLVKSFGKKSVPKGLKEFFVEINKIKFDSEPKYSVLKNILINKLAKNKRSVNDDEEEEEESDEEVIRYSPKRKKTNSKSNLNSNKNSINNKSPKKTLTSTNNKSPKKTSRKSSDVIVISDDGDDNESDEEVFTRSPPKRAKNNFKPDLNSEKNNNFVRLRNTPQNSKSNLKPRFSTPLLFCTSSEDNTTYSVEEEEEVVTGGDIETPEMMAIRKLMEKKKKEMEDKKKKRNRK